MIPPRYTKRPVAAPKKALDDERRARSPLLGLLLQSGPVLQIVLPQQAILALNLLCATSP
jgi:hypothetical protein